MKFFAFVCVLVIGLSFVVMCSADLPFIQYQNFGRASFPDISIVHQFEANIVQYETMGELLLDTSIPPADGAARKENSKHKQTAAETTLCRSFSL